MLGRGKSTAPESEHREGDKGQRSGTHAHQEARADPQQHDAGEEDETEGEIAPFAWLSHVAIARRGLHGVQGERRRTRFGSCTGTPERCSEPTCSVWTCSSASGECDGEHRSLCQGAIPCGAKTYHRLFVRICWNRSPLVLSGSPPPPNDLVGSTLPSRSVSPKAS